MTGAWRLLELLDELDEFDELDELDEFDELDELDEVGELDGVAELEEFELPPLDVPAPVDDVPELLAVDELELPVVLCVEPGSAAATAPAASTLATPTVAVAVFSLRRPRSRSATASETCRAARWARGAPLRSSQLSIIAV